MADAEHRPETIANHHPLPPPPKMAHDEKAAAAAAPSPGRRGYYGDPSRRRSHCRFIFALLVLATIIFLIVWLVHRPHKPKFTVVSATVQELNVSAPDSISTTMQFTVVTRNSNRRVKFYYDHLSAFVAYKDQAITPPVMLPPLFHETKSTVALSPVIGGVAMPVPADLLSELVTEEGYGLVGLRLVLTGRLRYRAAGGMRVGGRRGVYVRCDLMVGPKNWFVGQLPRPCSVDA